MIKLKAYLMKISSDGQSPKVSGFLKIISVIFTVFPLALLVFCVRRYAVDVLIGDEWRLMPLIEKSFSGHLSFFDFWAQSNEHRTVISKMAMIMIGRWSHWNLFYLYGFDVFLAAVTFVLLALMIWRTRRTLGRHVDWLIPLVSFLVFSLRQWESWAWASVCPYFLTILSVVAAIFLLSGPAFRWKNFSGALVYAATAVFSFGAGFALLPAGFFSLLFLDYKNRSQKISALMTWLLFFGAMIFVYKRGLEIQMSYHPSIFYGLSHPLEFIRYYLAFLGGSFQAQIFFVDLNYPPVMDENAPVVLGAVGIFLLIAGVLCCFRIPRFKKEVGAGFVSLGIFSVATGLMVATGRSGFGVRQALLSRYITLSYFLWIYAVVFLAWIFISTASKIVKNGVFVSLVFIAGFTVFTCFGPIHCMREERLMLDRARQELLVLKHDELLGCLHSQPELIKQEVPVLKRLGISVYRTNA